MLKNILLEKMVLKTYTKYAEAVTEAYKARPLKENDMSSWISLRQSNDRMFKRLSSVIEVIWTKDDPYSSQQEMKEKVKRTGKLYINTDYSSNLVSGWSEEDNWKFRAVHDFIVHIGGNVDFTQKGEIQAFNVHAKIAPKAALDALFSEVVGQACYVTVTGDFPNPQKACVLYGFDYYNVGLINWNEYRKNFIVNSTREYTEEEINNIIQKVRF